MHDVCPCGSGLNYQQCCGPLHQSKSHARSAEQLMRSRFCAFKLELSEYLLATQHVSKHTPNALHELQVSFQNTTWLSLQIITSSRDSVEFVAYYQADPFAQLHERSRFIEEHGRWFYLDGEQLPPIKLNRNQPCPCASGRKYKQCCAIK